MLGLDPARMVVLVAAGGTGPALAVLLVTLPFLGGLAPVLAIVVGAAAAYSIASVPKRIVERSALMQAREAPTLAAAGAVYLHGSRSRSKTIMMLRSEDPMLSSFFSDMKRSILLGIDPGDGTARSSERVQSESALRVLRSISQAQGERLEDEGEELEGLVRNSAAGEETKFPVFMTIAFFLPIMLMIFAGIEHHTDPIAMGSLAFLEIVVLDLALSMSSTEHRRLAT